MKGKVKAGGPPGYRPPVKRITPFPHQALLEGHSHARTAHPRSRLRRPPGIPWPPGAPRIRDGGRSFRQSRFDSVVVVYCLDQGAGKRQDLHRIEIFEVNIL